MSLLDWIDFKERSFSLNDSGNITLQGVPDICPHCDRKISVELKETIKGSVENGLFIYFFCFQCPACKEIIIGKYYQSGNIFTIVPRTSGHSSFYPEKSFIPTVFPQLLNELSPLFSDLYNQAAKAEHYGCGKIAGAGYRKALEFLIKDFAIYQHPDEASSIKKTLLGPVIQQKIESKKIQEIAKRAAWLGNDETHYERIWVDKDLSDLKDLISITVSFIETELQADSYIKKMSLPKKEAK